MKTNLLDAKFCSSYLVTYFIMAQQTVCDPYELISDKVKLYQKRKRFKYGIIITNNEQETEDLIEKFKITNIYHRAALESLHLFFSTEYPYDFIEKEFSKHSFNIFVMTNDQYKAIRTRVHRGEVFGYLIRDKFLAMIDAIFVLNDSFKENKNEIEEKIIVGIAQRIKEIVFVNESGKIVWKPEKKISQPSIQIKLEPNNNINQQQPLSQSPSTHSIDQIISGSSSITKS